MKLVAIYCVWGDYQLLSESVKHIKPLVDGVMIISSEFSNFGEKTDEPTLPSTDFKPNLKLSPADNERAKRNYGLQIARSAGYTHFIMLDADEFYDPYEFLKEKERFLNTDLAGTVCKVKTYFKKPTLTIGYDVTLVPFIHKITQNLCFTWNRFYPFAFEGPKLNIRIDPTRQMNINEGVEWSEITMHHYSWVRSDLEKKIRNSTARRNLERSTILQDYQQAVPGYYCEFYKARLVACENQFNLPEIIDDKYKGLQ